MKTSPIYLLLFISVLVKVLLAAFTPVFGDETYYHLWSTHLQLSYFDHPPAVSWLIWLSQNWTQTNNPLFLRMSFVILSFLTSLVWIKILRLKEFSEASIFKVLLLFLLHPLIGVGSILATPDVPLVFFWSLAYLSFLQIFKKKTYLWYALLGVFLGLGFCSKYHIVLFVISGLVYLFISKSYKLIRLSGVFLTLLFGALFSLPVIVWNAQNNWVSFLFQIDHGFGEDYFVWDWPVGYIVAQFLIVNPLVVISFFKKNWQHVDKVFSLTQLGFFFISSFKGVVEGNWPLASHLHSNTYFVSTASKRLYHYAVAYWIVFYVLIAGFFISSASEDVKRNLVNSTQIEELVPLTEIYSPLYGPTYQISSLLSWKTQKNIPKLRDLARHDFYDSLPESVPTTNVFYVLKYDISEWPVNYSNFEKKKLRSFDKIKISLYQLTKE